MKATWAEPGLAMRCRIVCARSVPAASAASGSAISSAQLGARGIRLCSTGILQRLRGRGLGVVVGLRMPEIIEVEPVVGSFAHVVLQPRGVRADVAVQRSVAIRTRQVNAFGQRFEDQLVA